MTWIIILIFILASLAWFGWTYFDIRRAAKFVDNAEFEGLLHGGQLIDVREASAFQTKHILGARNLPASQLQSSLSAIRKDKPVLIYSNSRSTNLPRVIKTLKKAGFTNMYVLRDGFDYWTGKVKGK